MNPDSVKENLEREIGVRSLTLAIDCYPHTFN